MANPAWRAGVATSVDFSTTVLGYALKYLPADFYATYSVGSQQATTTTPQPVTTTPKPVTATTKPVTTTTKPVTTTTKPATTTPKPVTTKPG